MINLSQSCDPYLHHLAIRLARACRNVVQACLREEEWRLADEEFYKVIRSGLEQVKSSNPTDAGGSRVDQAAFPQANQ